jgi:hypothetical protein
LAFSQSFEVGPDFNSSSRVHYQLCHCHLPKFLNFDFLDRFVKITNIVCVCVCVCVCVMTILYTHTHIPLYNVKYKIFNYVMALWHSDKLHWSFCCHSFEYCYVESHFHACYGAVYFYFYLFEDFLQPVGLNRYGDWSLGNSFKNFFFKFTLKNVSNSFFKQEKVFK